MSIEKAIKILQNGSEQADEPEATIIKQALSELAPAEPSELSKKYSEILDAVVIAFATTNEEIIRDKVQAAIDYGRCICTEFDRLTAELAKREKRLLAMYAGDLSPESRLSGYKVVTEKLQKRRNQLIAENQKLKEELEKTKTQLRKLCELSFYEDITQENGKDYVYSMRINEITFIRAQEPLSVIDYIFNSMKYQFYSKLKSLGIGKE